MITRSVDALRARRRDVSGLVRWFAKLGGASLTQKHQAKETDINVIVERFRVTGMAPVRLDVFNLERFDEIWDYQSAMNQVVAAQREFLNVPAKIRARFENDPQQFAAFVSDPANADELVKLKLATAKPKPVEVIQKVEIVNPPAAPAAPAPKAT